MSESQSIQWFPGHMAKTRRRITEDLKLVDIAVELLDARIPLSSRNPVLGDILKAKPRVVLLNKSDLADPAQTRRWVEYYARQGVKAVPLDCKSGKGVSGFYSGIREALSEQIARWEEKGMKGRPIRVMVVGVPNVGKSSLINRLIGSRGKAEAQNRPGVTKRNSWFTVGKGFELLDTPGVLWPKFEDPVVGERLAFTGAVKDEILDREGLAANLLSLLMKDYAPLVCGRYKLSQEDCQGLAGYELLERIARRRGMLISGGEADLERAAGTVLDEFRGGVIGRITLERP